MDSEFELRKFYAPEFIFGLDARQLVSRGVQNLHIQRILLVSDTGIQKAGWAREIRTMLESGGNTITEYSQISPNPRDMEIMNGAFLFQEHQCDGIIAIGGGSVIDAAKGIGIVVSHSGESILHFAGIDKVIRPMPPFIAIPTTSGTAADISRFAIINDTTRRTKIAIVSKSLVPDLSLIDPRLLTTVNTKLCACTGMDVLTHAIESYVSNASSPFTDQFAENAVRQVWHYLPLAVQDSMNLHAQNSMMQASTWAGLAFSNAGLGAVHSAAHSLGGYLDLPHGECNALMLPHVVRVNYPFAPERYNTIAAWLGLPTGSANSLSEALTRFREQLGITGGLRQRGVADSDLLPLSECASLDACNATNPRPMEQNDYYALFQEAL